MGNWKTEKEVEAIKQKYPKGTRLELEFMDEKGMPPGLKGIVDFIDDQGQLHMCGKRLFPCAGARRG